MNAPVRVRHIDLSRPELPAPAGEDAFLVFWWKSLPIGARVATAAELPIGRGSLRALACEFAAEQLEARDPDLGAPLRAAYEGEPKRVLTLALAGAIDRPIARLDRLALPSKRRADAISVVICTRDRGAALTSCLRHLREQHSPPGEIILVDNSKTASARFVCAEFPDIVFVHEPRGGLSLARNTGVSVAKNDLIAFTDDDVDPHPAWLAEIAAAFESSDAEAVTGLVLPACLDTLAQRCFELELGGFGRRFVPTLFDGRFFAETKASGAQVWKIGAGANMAFRRSAFERAGLFDPRLGAGASGCSEDSEFWYRILALGGTCLYEPRAVVFHHHRADWPALARQARHYMRGHVSALVAQHDRFHHRGNLRRIALQLPWYFLRTAVRTVLHGRRERRALLVQEVLGWLSGLQYLVRPAWRRARMDRIPR